MVLETSFDFHGLHDGFVALGLTNSETMPRFGAPRPVGRQAAKNTFLASHPQRRIRCRLSL